MRILDRDLRLAGIPKRDDRGRTLDVHALRTTFGTLLSKGGVTLRTAQAAMRHSDPSLTANVYTDPRLLDVHGALDALPTLPLDAGPDVGRESLRATGTETHDPSSVAPTVALTWCNRSQIGATPDKQIDRPLISMSLTATDENCGFSREIAVFSGVSDVGLSVARVGVEPTDIRLSV